MNGLMTEREWRRQAARPRPPRPACWGAQCVLPAPRKQTLKEDRAFHAFLVLLSFVVALLMPALMPRAERNEYPEAPAAANGGRFQPRAVSAISYTLPDGLKMQSVTYTSEQLTRGRLLLIDELHPLPKEAPAPNTMSVASYGKGMVPVNGLSVKSGRGTIQALARLFGDLRGQGVSGLCVWRGTLSAAEQRAARIAQARRLLPQMTVEDAIRQTLAETGDMFPGESQQEYTVEIRLSAGGASQPDPRPLEETQQGQALLRLAWRSGFIRREPNGTGARAFRFRYVGEAHATAMTYLDLTFEQYLEWLHQKGAVAVWQDGKPKYLILCKPMTGTHIEFSVPAGAACEASADNTGYAVVACTLNGS